MRTTQGTESSHRSHQCSPEKEAQKCKVCVSTCVVVLVVVLVLVVVVVVVVVGRCPLTNISAP